MSKLIIPLARLATSAPEMPVAPATLLKCLVTALIVVMPCTSALGQMFQAGNLNAQYDIVTTEGYHTIGTYTCVANVCSLPTSDPSPLPIPYPIVEVDSTDGALHGRMRIETNFEREGHDIELVTLNGTVSFSVGAIAALAPGAPIVLVEMGMMGITGSPGIMNKHTQSVSACGPGECGDTSTGSVSSAASFAVLSEAGDALASHTFESEDLTFAHSGRVEKTENASLSFRAAHRFRLAWSRFTSLSLDPSYQAGLHYAEDDFSHTMGFTSLRFYDPAGNDVSQWINVTYDAPFAFISAPVPEPETYAMMLAGLGLLGLMTRRRKQKLNA